MTGQSNGIEMSLRDGISPEAQLFCDNAAKAMLAYLTAPLEGDRHCQYAGGRDDLVAYINSVTTPEVLSDISIPSSVRHALVEVEASFAGGDQNERQLRGNVKHAYIEATRFATVPAVTDNSVIDLATATGPAHQ